MQGAAGKDVQAFDYTALYRLADGPSAFVDHLAWLRRAHRGQTHANAAWAMERRAHQACIRAASFCLYGVMHDSLMPEDQQVTGWCPPGVARDSLPSVNDDDDIDIVDIVEPP